MSNHDAYNAMVAECERTGFPQHYRDDVFFHDRLALGLGKIPERVYPFTLKDGSPFLWILRDCGSQISGVDEMGEVWNKDAMGYWFKNHVIGKHKIYYWNGKTLKSVKLMDVQSKYELIEKYSREVKRSLAVAV